MRQNHVSASKNRTISREILSLSYEFSRLPTAWASPPGNALWVGPLCFLSPLFTRQSVQAAAAAVRGSLPPPVGGMPCNGSSPHHTTNHDRRCKLRTATLNPRRFSVASNGMLIVGANIDGFPDTHAISTSSNESVFKSKIVSQWLSESSRLGEHVGALIIQESKFTGDHQLQVPGYSWFGRNRTHRFDESRGSAGVGILVCDNVLKGARVESRSPTYVAHVW